MVKLELFVVCHIYGQQEKTQHKQVCIRHFTLAVACGEKTCEIASVPLWVSQLHPLAGVAATTPLKIAHLQVCQCKFDTYTAHRKKQF